MTLPEIIVDSGHQYTNGSVSDFPAVYRPLVQAELTRAPQAEVEAYARRVGDTIRIYATFTNHSGTTLLYSSNAAKVHALVWEDAKVSVTSRWLRAAPNVAVTTALANDASASFTLDTGTLTVLDWTKLHTLALIDFRPGGSSGAYDMLQAAIAVPPAIVANPPSLSFSVPTLDPGTPSSQVSLHGPHVVTWNASSDAPWLSVTPTTGSLPAQPTISITPALLAGTSTGHVTFTGTSADGLSLTTTVAVLATRSVLTPGDVDADGTVSLKDAFYLINALFGGGPPAAGLSDPNGDGETSAADVFYLLNYFFAGGPAPKG